MQEKEEEKSVMKSKGVCPGPVCQVCDCNIISEWQMYLIMIAFILGTAVVAAVIFAKIYLLTIGCGEQ